MNYWIIPLVKHKNEIKLPCVSASYDAEVIIETVCKFYGVTSESICSKDRKRELVVARQMCMFFMKKHTDLTLKEIGHRFGGRDHTTALHGVNTIKDLRDTDEKIQRDLISIIELLKGNLVV